MIEFLYENEFGIPDEEQYRSWVERIVLSEKKRLGDISYTFCDDDFLDKLNREYLNHEDLTDIISFDNTVGNIISGDIFISTQRVLENSNKFDVEFKEELLRVMAHGVLHLIGFDDHNVEDVKLMRLKEEEKIKMFHVEQ